MEALMAVLTGVFFGVSIHLLQQRSILRLALGSLLLGHATNLILITLAGLKRGTPPILEAGGTGYTDPIPHALILTAIVIGFGVTAFLLVLAYRTYQSFRTDDLDALRDPAERLRMLEGEAAAHEQ